MRSFLRQSALCRTRSALSSHTGFIIFDATILCTISRSLRQRRVDRARVDSAFEQRFYVPCTCLHLLKVPPFFLVFLICHTTRDVRSYGLVQIHGFFPTWAGPETHAFCLPDNASCPL